MAEVRKSEQLEVEISGLEWVAEEGVEELLLVVF